MPGGFFGDGMPFSMEFMARPFDEPTLLRVASGYETESRRRRPPASTPALLGEVFDYTSRGAQGSRP